MEKSSKDSGMDRERQAAPKGRKTDPAYVLAAVAIWLLVLYSVTGPSQVPAHRLAQVCAR
jgi:hypothetical protein